MIIRRTAVSFILLSLTVGSVALATRPQTAPVAPPTEAAQAVDAAKAAAPKRDEAKRREIMRLLQLGGTREAMQAQIDTMSKGFANMNLPPEMITAMKEEFSKGLGEMVEMTVDVYERNFSMEEIKAFVAFYESPTGQKISKIMPTVLKESTEAGMKWGQQMQPRLMKRMAELRAAQEKSGAAGAAAPAGNDG